MAENKQQHSDRAAGILWAREWRMRNRPRFDAIYGVARCPVCRKTAEA
jgi:hypothetical protein